MNAEPRSNSDEYSGGIVFNRSERTIYLFKPRLSPEDEVALRFSRILDELGVKYAIVAGYIAILLGRSRGTEYIDFIAIPLTEDEFVELCRELAKEGFTLMRGDIGSDTSVRLIHRDYLVKGYSIRFMYRDTIFPNIEFKFSSTTIHGYAITNSYKAIINNEHMVKVSPPELQIAYKLYSGSDKDIGDAVYLYTILRDSIDSSELEKWCRELGVNCSILEGA